MKVLVYPKSIGGGYKLGTYLQHLGVPWTNDWTDPDITVAFHWDPRNSNELSEEMLSVKERGVRIINERCTNIKKDYLDEKFTEIFGYSLQINPTEHYGTVVKKGTQNAIHSGRLIECPIHPLRVDTKITKSDKGDRYHKLYLRFIDTRFDLDKVRDIRIPIMGDTIPLLFIKELGVLNTFHPFKENYYKVYTSYDFRRWITNDEEGKILELARVMGGDFCEVDALRDNSTGLLYICDMNNRATCSLFRHLGNKEETIDYLSQVFKEKLLC